MPDDHWFSPDDPEDPGVLDATETLFVDSLRAELASSAVAACSSTLFRDDVEPQILIACVFLEHVVFGVRREGAVVRGDRLHDQVFDLCGGPGEPAFEAEGLPEETGRRAGAWFAELLRRPVVREEWLHRGRAYAHRSMFADSGELLCGGHDVELAPWLDLFRRPLSEREPHRVTRERN